MNLKDANLKSSYDSDADDILNEFYIPMLSVAKKYKRVAGYFSSTSLALAATGIASFIKNGGEMELIINVNLSEEDFEAILEGTKNPENVISEFIIKDLLSLADEIRKNHVRALAWLVAERKLRIKVAITDRGIFHQKIGILEDSGGNMVSFSGSDNESASGWLFNVEEFKVFRSWKDQELQYLMSDIKTFEKYWEGKAERTRVIDLPTAAKEQLMQLCPKSKAEYGQIIEAISGTSNQKQKRTLRDYQTVAVSNWINNKKKGMLEMATGTGKTITAIACLDAIKKDEQSLVTVISCPYIHLVEQWSRELSLSGIDAIKAFGNSTQWKPKVISKILDFNNERISLLTIVTTHDTFSSEAFIKIINEVNGKIMLIADEVHGLGSPERKMGLIDKYDYRLGLSATPKRWFDEEGTDVLYSFFEKTVFEFTLKDAIERGYLTPYDYKPIFVGLTFSEIEEYKRQTKKIAMAYAGASKSSEKTDISQLFSIIRQRIVTNAMQKYDALEKIISGLGDLSHCLIYCSPQQIGEVQDMLNQKKLLQHKFTADENAEERENLLSAFAKGKYAALVAMKCLDEGVDVPPTKIAILMANSGNPKEFVQRRGRVLRTFPGKSKATIFDIIVVPGLDEIEPIYMDLETKIMRGELRRFLEFAMLASNSGEAVSKVVPYATKYGIALGE